VVLQFGGTNNPSPQKKLVTKCYTGPRNWGALVNAVMEGREFLD